MENPTYLFDQQYKKISLLERFLNFIGIEGETDGYNQHQIRRLRGHTRGHHRF
ncbi:Uncharacterised protein [Turicibacter sanguinis]|nr:Uncharacterised protein [Turicibacter sanguinis]